MDTIRQYLMTICASALICSSVRAFFCKKTGTNRVLYMLSGISMTLCILSPWVKVNLQNYHTYWSQFEFSASEAVQSGNNKAQDAYIAIIKEKAESYILDKAAFLESDLKVQVELSPENPPIPQKVIIKGAVSPFAKREISYYISDQLGISKENQLWE